MCNASYSEATAVRGAERSEADADHAASAQTPCPPVCTCLVNDTKGVVPVGDSDGDSSAEHIFQALGDSTIQTAISEDTSVAVEGSKPCGKWRRFRNRVTMCFDDLFEEDPPREITIRGPRCTYSVTMPGGRTVGDLQKFAVQKYRLLGGGRVGSARLQTAQGAVLNRYTMLSEINTEEEVVLIVHEQRGGKYGSGCGCSVTSVCSMCTTSSLCMSGSFGAPVAALCDSCEPTGSMGRISFGGSGSFRQTFVQFDSAVEVLE